MQCTNKNINLNVDDLANLLKYMTVTIDKHTLEEFVQIIDEHIPEYAKENTTEIQ